MNSGACHLLLEHGVSHGIANQAQANGLIFGGFYVYFIIEWE